MEIVALRMEPLEITRPRGAPRIESFSPKLGRRVRLYDRAAFELWLSLEADPLVREFCERPMRIKSDRCEWLADFWVRYARREELVLIDLRDRREAHDDVEIPKRAGTDRIAVRSIVRNDLLAMRPWTANWERMIPYLAANGAAVTRLLKRDVVGLCKRAKTLGAILEHFAETDPVLVRTAVIAGLHGGVLEAPSLRESALSFHTPFKASPT